MSRKVSSMGLAQPHQEVIGGLPAYGHDEQSVPEPYPFDSPATDLEAEEIAVWAGGTEQDTVLNDREILDTFQQEDADAGAVAAAFTTLMARHQAMVYGLVRRRGASREVADDIVQQTFVRTYLELTSVDRARRLSWNNAAPWITTVGKRLYLDYLKRSSTNLERSVGDMAANDIGGETISPEMAVAQRFLSDPAKADPMWQPEEAYILQHEESRLDWLRRHIDMLPPTQREACQAVYLRGISREQAAEELGIDMGALKSRLHRAKKSLQMMSAKYGDSDGMPPSASKPTPPMRMSSPVELPVEDEEPMLEPANRAEEVLLKRLARHFEDEYDAQLIVAVHCGRISMAQAAILAAMSPEHFAGRYQRSQALIAS